MSNGNVKKINIELANKLATQYANLNADYDRSAGKSSGSNGNVESLDITSCDSTQNIDVVGEIKSEISELNSKISDFFESVYETGADIVEGAKTKLNSFIIKIMYGSEELETDFLNELYNKSAQYNLNLEGLKDLYSSGDLTFGYQLVDGKAFVSEIKLPNGNILKLSEDCLIVEKSNGSIWRYGEIYTYVKSVDGRVLKLNKNNQLIAIYNNETDNVDIFTDFNQCGGDQGYFSSCNAEVVNNPIYFELLKEYFPDATLEDVEAFSYCFTEVGCGYIAAVNEIYKYFEGMENKFLKTFGYPMYSVNSDGSLTPNYDYLAFELAASRYQGCSIEDVYGNIQDVVASQNGVIVDGALLDENGNVKLDALFTGTTATDLNVFLDKFCEDHGVEFKIGLNKDDGWGGIDESLENYSILVKNGYKVVLAAMDFDMYYYDSINKKVGRIANKDVGAHAMSIIGITNDGKYIVSSWGDEYVCDLENATLTELFALKFGDDSSTISVADSKVSQNFNINSIDEGANSSSTNTVTETDSFGVINNLSETIKETTKSIISDASSLLEKIF